jgi:hypothetical protein
MQTGEESRVKRLALLLLVLVIIAAGPACNRSVETAQQGDILIDGFGPIIATNVDIFVESDDILGGELDLVVRSGVPRLEQAFGTRTMKCQRERPCLADWDYDGIDGAPIHAFDLGSVDLTAGGRLRGFQLGVTEPDSRTTVVIRVYGTAEDYMESPLLVADTAGTVEAPFDGFRPVGKGARFDRAKQISFEWGMPPGRGVTLDSLRIVP